MAYMSQERKKAFAPAIKALCKKYGFKHTLSVDHHSTIELNIWKGKYDLLGMYNEKLKADRNNKDVEFHPATYFEVQPYCRKWFNEELTEFFNEAFKILNNGNHDRSDLYTDYFDIGWYIDINIGRWNKSYQIIE